MVDSSVGQSWWGASAVENSGGVILHVIETNYRLNLESNI